MKEMDRMDQLIEKVVIEGIEFQIIQKPATLYAGYRAETDNGDEESNVDTSQLFQAGYKNIKNSLTPDSMLCLSITGEDNPQWHMAPLFGLCEKLFCNEERGFALTPDFSDTYEIEYYNADGINYAGISVVKL